MIKQQKYVFTFLLAFVLIAISSANADVVHLHGGSEVHGNVIKRTDNTLWIDIGPKVIQISM
ncbi:MAG TPA: hypothetical protein EYO40_06020, partial [Phycisphaerales bacterium]|nr:hypothetical protein [Phycisphaerales bacterium]